MMCKLHNAGTGLALLGAALWLNCAASNTGKPYTNYYIPLERGFTELGREGKLPETPRIYVENGTLFIRPETFSHDKAKQAQADAFEEMSMIAGKVTGQLDIAQKSDLVAEQFVGVLTREGEEKFVVEALYAFPLSLFSPEKQRQLIDDYTLRETSTVIDMPMARVKKDFTGTFYTNPCLDDSVQILQVVKGEPLTVRPVYTVTDTGKKEKNYLYIMGYSGFCEDREKAEHNASRYMNTKLEELAGKLEVLRVVTEAETVMRVTSTGIDAGYVVEKLYRLPLSQFSRDVRNRLKISY